MEVKKCAAEALGAVGVLAIPTLVGGLADDDKYKPLHSSKKMAKLKF